MILLTPSTNFIQKRTGKPWHKPTDSKANVSIRHAVLSDLNLGDLLGSEAKRSAMILVMVKERLPESSS